MRFRLRRLGLAFVLFVLFLCCAALLNWKSSPNTISATDDEQEEQEEEQQYTTFVFSNGTAINLTLNERRLMRMKNVCQLLAKTTATTGNRSHTLVNTSPLWTPGPLDDMLVDDKLKLIYCPVGKVATRSWKFVLLRAAGRDVNMGQADNRHILAKYLPQLRTYNENGESLRRLRTHFKFMIVRDPMERFVSAYNYLFRTSSFYQHSVGRQIIQRYRPNATADAWRHVAIDEFVRFVLDEHRAGMVMDRHWRPMYQLCYPCQVQYDYIGHYETLDRDGDDILRKLGVHDTVQFPFRARKRTTAKVLRNNLHRVSVDQLRQLLAVYSPDYQLFGYSMPNW